LYQRRNLLQSSYEGVYKRQTASFSSNPYGNNRNICLRNYWFAVYVCNAGRKEYRQSANNKNIGNAHYLRRFDFADTFSSGNNIGLDNVCRQTRPDGNFFGTESMGINGITTYVFGRFIVTVKISQFRSELEQDTEYGQIRHQYRSGNRIRQKPS